MARLNSKPRERNEKIRSQETEAGSLEPEIRRQKLEARSQEKGIFTRVFAVRKHVDIVGIDHLYFTVHPYLLVAAGIRVLKSDT
jgi:hypothetical protein